MVLNLPSMQEMKAARLRLGLTQSTLAQSAGVSQPLIARLENGSVDPRYSTLKSIIEALNRAERQEVFLKDVMTTPVVAVRSTDGLHEAISLMREKDISQLPVLNKGLPVGSLSERNVVSALAHSHDPETIKRASVQDVMGPPFPTVAPNESVDHVYSLLEDHPAILVVERGRLVGLVSKSNMLKLFG